MRGNLAEIEIAEMVKALSPELMHHDERGSAIGDAKSAALYERLEALGDG